MLRSKTRICLAVKRVRFKEEVQSLTKRRFYIQYIYIYLEPVCPLFLGLPPSKTRTFPIKTSVIWVPGIKYYAPEDPFVCPKKGISPIQSYDLGMGFFDHQSYSREGSGFLGVYVRIMESQNWCFGDPRTLRKKQSQPLFFGGSK